MGCWMINDVLMPELELELVMLLVIPVLTDQPCQGPELRSLSGPAICEAARPPGLSRPLRSKARDEAAWAAPASANLQPPPPPQPGLTETTANNNNNNNTSHTTSQPQPDHAHQAAVVLVWYLVEVVEVVVVVMRDARCIQYGERERE